MRGHEESQSKVLITRLLFPQLVNRNVCIIAFFLAIFLFATMFQIVDASLLKNKISVMNVNVKWENVERSDNIKKWGIKRDPLTKKSRETTKEEKLNDKNTNFIQIVEEKKDVINNGSRLLKQLCRRDNHSKSSVEKVKSSKTKNKGDNNSDSNSSGNSLKKDLITENSTLPEPNNENNNFNNTSLIETALNSEISNPNALQNVTSSIIAQNDGQDEPLPGREINIFAMSLVVIGILIVFSAIFVMCSILERGRYRKQFRRRRRVVSQNRVGIIGSGAGVPFDIDNRHKSNQVDEEIGTAR
ncbi:hypothetical protein G9A89_018284 [Geosiphon pyriformis]|nr:hypothetical protein G9A89_018284 [Geosiphon pyriformis]